MGFRPGCSIAEDCLHAAGNHLISLFLSQAKVIGQGTRGILHGHLATIREEFEHNVTQQIYVSDRAWARVRQAREETTRLVNLSHEQIGGSASAADLSRAIFENSARLTHTPSQEALVAIKEEVRRLF